MMHKFWILNLVLLIIWLFVGCNNSSDRLAQNFISDIATKPESIYIIGESIQESAREDVNKINTFLKKSRYAHNHIRARYSMSKENLDLIVISSTAGPMKDYYKLYQLLIKQPNLNLNTTYYMISQWEFRKLHKYGPSYFELHKAHYSEEDFK